MGTLYDLQSWVILQLQLPDQSNALTSSSRERMQREMLEGGSSKTWARRIGTSLML